MFPLFGLRNPTSTMMYPQVWSDIRTGTCIIPCSALYDFQRAHITDQREAFHRHIHERHMLHRQTTSVPHMPTRPVRSSIDRYCTVITSNRSI